MPDISTVFTKVFVREFYRLNAGFFIVVITLTFGFMSGREHKALAEFFVASPVLTLIPIAVWVFYAGKVVLFNRQRMALSENIFLYNTSLLSRAQQFMPSLQASTLQLMPVVLYGSFLLLTALKNSFVESLLLLVVAIIALVLVSSLLLIQGVRTPIPEFKTSKLKRFIDEHTVRPIWWIYIVTVLRQEPFLFVGTKIFSGLLLFAVMQLYIAETYDERLLAMAAAIAGIGNYMVMSQLQLFDFRYFLLMRSLPITLLQRWFHLMLIIVILILPEIVLITKYAPPLPLVEIISIMLLIPALSLVAYALLYIRFTNEETYGRITFALGILHIVLILFQVPIWIFVIADVGIAWAIFRSMYYRFELPPSLTK